MVVVVLMPLLMTTASMAQVAELKTQVSALGSAVGPAQSGSRNYEQKISFSDPAIIRYSYDETDQKGNRTNYAFEFNLADIDPYAVREQTQRDLITVVLAARNKQKLIKAYKNEVVQPYDAEVTIISKDIENARVIVDILKKSIPLAEKVMASRLKLSAYDPMISWLVANVKDINVGGKTIKQSLVKGGQPGVMIFTRVETDSKGSSEETITFNLVDVNPNAVVYRIAGSQFAINIETLQKAKYFQVKKDGQSKPYVDELVIHTNNPDEARDLKHVLTSVIPLSFDKVKASMPAVGSDKDGVQKTAALVRDITYGEKQTLQKIEGGCLTEVTQVQKDLKSSSKSVLKFNWMDVNPLTSNIEVSGEKLYLDLHFANDKKLVMHTADEKFKGYENSIRLYATDVEEARRLKFVLDKVVEKCKAAYKEPFGNDVASTTAFFQSSVKELSVEETTLKQTVERVEGEDNKFKLTIIEVNPKGASAEQVYEFNLADINPLSVAVDVRGKWMYVVLETDFKGKIIKYYKDGKIQPYASALQLAVSDVDVARNLVAAVSRAAKAAKAK